jgi:hypothetical protein
MSEENVRTINGKRGELAKINVEGCRGCGRVWLSEQNARRIGAGIGWHPLSELQQRKPGENGLDMVFRVRGSKGRQLKGRRICPDCKTEEE